MATYILLSSVEYHTGFYPAAAHFITGSLPDTKSLLLIASHANDFEKTDNNARALFMHLTNLGIVFGEYRILDRRMKDGDQKKAVENASVVFLSGGDTLAQIEYIKAQGLTEVLRGHSYVIGLSAGAINMAKRSVVPKNPYRKHTWVYEGTGLVGLTVIPHFERYDDAFLKTEILPLTREDVIFGLYENAAVMVQNGQIRYGGKIMKMENEQKQFITGDEDFSEWSS